MIHFKKIDHVQLCIPPGSEDEARAFYGTILGLKEIPKPDELLKNGGLWYEIADIQLHIGVEESNEISLKRHPAFVIDRFEEAKNFLKQQGVRLKEEVGVSGKQRLSIYDPFGNRIELMGK